MEIKKEIKKDCYAIKIMVRDNDKEVGRVWLYILQNNIHKEPYGLLADLLIDKEYRGGGWGTKLLQEVIEEAKKSGCYKLIATTRSSREIVCAWYEKFGFKNYGVEFRMDLI